MHEFSAASELVEEIKKGIEGYDVERVTTISISLGELTFLSPEQLTFAIETLCEGSVLEGASVEIEIVKASIKCTSCDFEGKPPFTDTSFAHYGVPLLFCPECSEPVSIVSGDCCIVENVRAEVGSA